ncbi:hypothetical protein JKF63_02276 [Porcisia hertigi]|uniref:Uncharacterized protein n=1 Tax=Porcisia hertigi TaxID=2761500 RepID=A0A836IDF8_9TRYP|nr:hypothetical protein JKF63_02276 [Porcisia hertigi]
MALEAQKEELQRQVETVQQMRLSLHDASIAEGKVSQGDPKDERRLRSAPMVRRTVDAPTLTVLKSPNYPFTLCEEAPPAYLPPPVPYDVEGEVESLKQRVLQVQEDLQMYQNKHNRGGAPLSASQTLDFFSQSNTYAEMAWEVSSLQGLYRWVLSHSISHLWNCKEQLEYVLTEHGQDLPKTVEEMDASLQAYPFIAAVSILASDRQEVVAQERCRLRSSSRTFRDKVPARAVTAATSCYLSAEEKYMYQEFYNQSEHMLLLLSHALMIDKANGTTSTALKPRQNKTSTGQLSHFQSQDCGFLQDKGAALLPSVAVIGEMDIDTLATETFFALSAEREVITALMKVIQTRQERGECFEASATERERRRSAMVAVYGCVLSDMSLMAHQMNLIVEFIEHYEAWLRLHGYDNHDQLMNALSQRSAGTPWPTLDTDGDRGSRDGHSHFVPPTEMMTRYYRPPQKKASEVLGIERRRSASETGKSVTRSKASPVTNSSGSSPALRPPPTAAVHAKTAAAKVADAHSVVSPISALRGTLQRARNEVAGAFHALLIHATEAAGDKAAAGWDADRAIGRLWLTACVRYTVIKLLRHEWRALEVAKNMPTTEDTLLALVGGERALPHMNSTAAALCVVVQGMARLIMARSPPRSLIAEVPITVHIPNDVDNYAKAVSDVTNVVEQQRWGSLLDALWFQVDPSAASSGGLLFSAIAGEGEVTGPVPTNSQGAAHFLYIECIEMPSNAVTYGVASITMCYRLPRMSPAAKTSRRVAPTLASLSDAQPSSREGLSRYHLARRALSALSQVEAKGLLPCFACRLSEVSSVPLNQMIYITFDDGDTATVVDENHAPHLCMLPPAAMELRRLHAIVGMAPAPTRATDELYMAFEESVNFGSVGLLIAALLEDMAAPTPVSHDLYMAASTVREKAVSDIKRGVPPEEFEKVTTHPISIACGPEKVRVMSIQRESVANRNSILVRPFIAPLLRHIDDRISSLVLGEDTHSKFNKGLNNSSIRTQASGWKPRAAAEAELQSVTSRQTEMVGGDGRTSSSPSAVRPGRR